MANFKTEEEFLQELKKSFLAEAVFMLEECEEAFMNLESVENKQDELNRIFRLMHSMKGTSGSVGFAHFSNFSHHAEELLCILRVHNELCSTEIISLLLEINDKLKQYISVLKEDINTTLDCSDLVSRIKFFVDMYHDGNEVTQHIKTENEIMDDSSIKLPAGHPGFVIFAEEEEKERLDKEENLKKKIEEPIQVKGNEEQLKEIKTHVSETPVKNEVKHLDSPKLQLADKDAAQKSAIVKLSADRIDAVLDLIGELVVIKSQLVCNEILSEKKDQHLGSLLMLLDKIVRELQDKALSMRMTSIRPLFLKVHRALRDLSIKLDKPVDVTLKGEETEIDRAVFESLGDPLMHLCRNALDHGIEAKAKRLENGKNQIGKITLDAGYQGGKVFIDIQDDGAGIIREKILARAVQKGLVSSEANTTAMSDSQVYDLLFAPGFSTAEVVSEISGRGVGLDVVKSSVEQMKGNIEITSKPGEGTRFRLWIPLTTAIADAMKVRVHNDIYALPMENISELLQPEQNSIVRLNNKNEVIQVRGNFLPLIRLKKWVKSEPLLDFDEPISGTQTVVVVEERGNQIALLVDEVLGQSQVVIKALGDVFKHVKGIGGGAILGDGKVGLILDLEGLIASVHNGQFHAALNQLNQNENHFDASVSKPQTSMPMRN